MQVVQTKSYAQTEYELNIKWAEPIDCRDIRSLLDAIFSGRSALEAAPIEIKHRLFAHLESCGQCCRSFDVRVRFRSPQRSRIY